MLQREVGQVLAAGGEHDSVDLRHICRGRRGRHADSLLPAGCRCPDCPLQTGVAIDEPLLMGKVPDAGSPVLQINIAQLGFRANEQLDAAAVQTVSRRAAAGRFREQSRLGTFLKYDEDVPQIDAAIGERQSC